MNPENLKNGDNEDLEAMFNQIAEQRVWESSDSHSGSDNTDLALQQSEATLSDLNHADSHPEQSTSESASKGNDEPHDVFTRIGHLTRNLHDALRELGYDSKVEDAVSSLPDARARLSYIANLTGQAANKVLAGVERCQNINDDMAAKAKEMDEKWDQLFNNEMSLQEFKEHVYETHHFIKSIRSSTSSYSSEFTEIMISQDFHDLTGQVVNRIADMAQNLETQLVKLLLDTTPVEQRKNVQDQWLTGPTIDATNRTDVCSDQSQVDDLLESLGF